MQANQRDEVIAHLGRITSSKTFSTSPRLIEFLRYCVETSVHGDAHQLKESTIGVSVFGRPPDYDPKLDPIVRVHARRLRDRLESFYETEGISEEIIVEIPKGGYVPSFGSRIPEARDLNVESPAVNVESPAAEELVVATECAHPSAIPAAAKPTRLQWASIAVVSFVLVATVALRWSRADATMQHSSSQVLLDAMFRPSEETLLVPGDSGLIIHQGLTMRQTNLDAYLRGDYRNTVKKIEPGTPSTKTDLSSRRYTSIVDLQIASGLTQRALSEHSLLKVRFARDLRPNDLKLGNVILVGAAEANPWVELFERNMNFVMRDDLETGVFSVVNRSPKPDELTHWDSAVIDPEHHVFGIVAFLPNLAGNGDTLILEGTSMAGTEAAWDFVSDDSQLQPFLKSIRRDNGTVPHFEVVLGTTNMGASAVRSTVVAWRSTN
jgi:hypothetical protein